MSNNCIYLKNEFYDNKMMFNLHSTFDETEAFIASNGRLVTSITAFQLNENSSIFKIIAYYFRKIILYWKYVEVYNTNVLVDIKSVVETTKLRWQEVKECARLGSLYLKCTIKIKNQLFSGELKTNAFQFVKLNNYHQNYCEDKFKMNDGTAQSLSIKQIYDKNTKCELYNNTQLKYNGCVFKNINLSKINGVYYASFKQARAEPFFIKNGKIVYNECEQNETYHLLDRFITDMTDLDITKNQVY